MNQQAFRFPSGALYREQSICLASKMQQRTDSEADACYHFRQLFADSWLPSQIAFVQVRSFNPPSLLLKPFKANSIDGSSWEELRSWINHRGFNLGWSATISADHIDTKWPSFPFFPDLSWVAANAQSSTLHQPLRSTADIDKPMTLPTNDADKSRSNSPHIHQHQVEESHFGNSKHARAAVQRSKSSSITREPASGEADVSATRKLLKRALHGFSQTCKEELSERISPATSSNKERPPDGKQAKEDTMCCETGEASCSRDRPSLEMAPAPHLAPAKGLKTDTCRPHCAFASNAPHEHHNKASESAVQGNHDPLDQSSFPKHDGRKRRFSETEGGVKSLGRNLRARSAESSLGLQYGSSSASYFGDSTYAATAPVELHEYDWKLSHIDQQVCKPILSFDKHQNLPSMPDQEPICFGCSSVTLFASAALCEQCYESLNGILLGKISGQEIAEAHNNLVVALRRLLVPS